MALFWLSFARPRENYVVLSEADDVDAAIKKAMPLKDFNPRGWALEAYEVPADGPEAKDFERNKLITEVELHTKGYFKPSELKARN